jgi:tRNA-2-methylthio-N6-dimethylallyladenosine synthase
MRRGYDREKYISKIEGLRRRIPNMLFGTDIIVGFPGETDEEFEDTLSLLDEIQYDTVYSFTYSTRPGTAALAWGDDVDPALKNERLQRLQGRQKQIQEIRNRAWIGREVEVLVEGPSKRDPTRWTGRTPENRLVHFPGRSASGRLERVKILDFTPFSFRAETLASLA